MSAPRWYAAGLRFECTRCGNCCRSHGDHTHVYLTTPEVEALAAHLGLAREDFLERYCAEDEGWTVLQPEAPACPFLSEEGLCTVYEARPLQCRTWPFWEENLRSEQAWRACAETCPGIGRGEPVPADEARAIARHTEAWYESDGAT